MLCLDTSCCVSCSAELNGREQEVQYLVMDRLKMFIKLLLVDEVRFMTAVTADMMP